MTDDATMAPPSVRQAYASLAAALDADDQLDLAAAAIDDALGSAAAEPSDVELLERLADLHRRRSDRAQAYAAYLRVIEIAPGQAAPAARRATELLAEDRRLAHRRWLAPATWREVIAATDGLEARADVVNLAVEAALERGDVPTAIELLQQLVSADPGDHGASLRLARLQLDAGVEVERISELLDAIASGPGVPFEDDEQQRTGYRILLAQTALDRADHRGALEILGSFGTVEDERFRADALLADGQREAAVTAARAAIDLDQKETAARLILAQALCAEGRWEEARDEATRATQLNPVAVEPILVKAQIVVEQRADLAAAIHLLKRTNRLGPRSSIERVLRRAGHGRGDDPRATAFRLLVELRLTERPTAFEGDWRHLRAAAERTNGPGRGLAHLLIDHLEAEHLARSGELGAAEPKYLGAVAGYQAVDDGKNAAASLEIAVALDPDRAVYRWHLVEQYARLPDDEGGSAETSYVQRAADQWDEAVLKLGAPASDYTWAYLIRGWVAGELGRRATEGAAFHDWQAAVLHETAAAIDHESTQVLGYVAAAYRALGLSRLAEDAVDTAGWSPQHPPMLLGERAAVLAEADRREEAGEALAALRTQLGEQDDFADMVSVYLDYVNGHYDRIDELGDRIGPWGVAIRAASLVNRHRDDEARSLYRSLVDDDLDPVHAGLVLQALFVLGRPAEVLELAAELRERRQIWPPDANPRVALASLLVDPEGDRSEASRAIAEVIRLNSLDELAAELNLLSAEADADEPAHDRLKWASKQLERQRGAIEAAQAAKRSEPTPTAGDEEGEAGRTVAQLARRFRVMAQASFQSRVGRSPVELEPKIDIAKLLAADEEDGGAWAIAAGRLAEGRLAIRSDGWALAIKNLSGDRPDRLLDAIIVAARRRVIERAIDPLVETMAENRRGDVDEILAAIDDLDLRPDDLQRVQALRALHLFANGSADEARATLAESDLDPASVGAHWATTMRSADDWAAIDRYLLDRPMPAGVAGVRQPLLDELGRSAGLVGDVNTVWSRSIGIDLGVAFVPADTALDTWPLFVDHLSALRQQIRDRHGFELPGVRVLGDTDSPGCAAVINEIAGPIVPLHHDRSYLVGPGLPAATEGDDVVLEPDLLSGEPAGWFDDEKPAGPGIQLIGGSDAVAIRVLEAALRGRLGELLPLEIVANAAAEAVGPERTLAAETLCAIADAARSQVDETSTPFDLAELARTIAGDAPTPVGDGETKA